MTTLRMDETPDQETRLADEEELGSRRALLALSERFRTHALERHYLALVAGAYPEAKSTLKFPVGGRPARTHVDVIERFGDQATLLRCRLETGRTHQIRVHMAALKHPCVGDITYGADPVLARRLGLERQWLHAVRLGFHHPETGEYVEYESPYPEDLKRALDIIRDEV